MNNKTFKNILLGARILLIIFLLFVCVMWGIAWASDPHLPRRTHARMGLSVLTVLAIILAIANYSKKNL